MRVRATFTYDFDVTPRHFVDNPPTLPGGEETISLADNAALLTRITSDLKNDATIATANATPVLVSVISLSN